MLSNLKRDMANTDGRSTKRMQGYPRHTRVTRMMGCVHLPRFLCVARTTTQLHGLMGNSGNAAGLPQTVCNDTCLRVRLCVESRGLRLSKRLTN